MPLDQTDDDAELPLTDPADRCVTFMLDELNTVRFVQRFRDGTISKLELAKLLAYLRSVVIKNFNDNLSEAERESATERALEQAFLARKTFRGESKFTTWLNPIAKAAACFIYRKNRAHPTVSAEGIEDQGLDLADPRDRQGEAEMEIILAQVMQTRLTPAEARAFDLCRRQGLSNIEAAEREGTTPGAIASRLAGAIDKLRRFFEEEYHWGRNVPSDGRARRTERPARPSPVKTFEYAFQDSAPMPVSAVPTREVGSVTV